MSAARRPRPRRRGRPGRAVRRDAPRRRRPQGDAARAREHPRRPGRARRPAGNRRRGLPPRHRPHGADHAGPVRGLLRRHRPGARRLGRAAAPRPGLPRPVRRRQQPVPHLGPRRDDRADPAVLGPVRRRRLPPLRRVRQQALPPADAGVHRPQLQLAAGPGGAVPGQARGDARVLPPRADGRPLLQGRAAPEGLQLPGHVRRGVPPAGARDLRGHLLHGPGRGRLLPRRRA